MAKKNHPTRSRRWVVSNKSNNKKSYQHNILNPKTTKKDCYAFIYGSFQIMGKSYPITFALQRYGKDFV